ncbi:MAG: GntR family transcriptional regulator [Gammaproteobacteria bacterium]
MAKSKKRLTLPPFPRSGQSTAQEYAYGRLRHSLMIGAIAPGQQLTIRKIADALGLSPTPVREALRRLSSENAVAVMENRRIMVPNMTVARFEELVSLRAALETHAAKRAIPYINKMCIDEIERIDDLMDEAVEKREYESIVKLNQRFHSAIYLANPEQVALPMIESVWLQLGPFLGVAAQHVEEVYLVDRHKETIEALRRRDALTLGMAVEADVYDGVSHLGRGVLKKILGVTDTET